MIMETALVAAEIADQLVVVETYDGTYLGVPHVHEGQVAVGTDDRGRPTILQIEDVIDVTAASAHPLVDFGP